MDKRNWTYKLTVLESYMDQSYDWVEAADQALSTDMAQTGIHSGFTAAQDPAGPNLKVQISGPGYAHDKVGRRLYESDSTVLVDCEFDEYGIATAVTLASGLERQISIFARFKTQYAEPIVDGNSVTVFTKEYEDVEFFVRQAAEVAAPSTTYVALQTEAILICDIKLTDGMTQIQNADIVLNRREDWYRELAATLLNLGDQAFGTPLAAVDQMVQWIDDLQLGTAIGFTGAATWHDTTTIAAITLSTAIEEIVTVLAEDTTNPGSDLIGSDTYVAGGTFTMTRGSVWDQLKEIADAIDISVQSNADENITGQWDYTNFVTIDCSAVATNTTALTCTGNGSGAGGIFTGGDASGNGITVTGGAAAGIGGPAIFAYGGAVNGTGIKSVADGTGVGVAGFGDGISLAIPLSAQGGGIYGIGDTTDGTGIIGIGGTSNGTGGSFLGDGTGRGILTLGTGASDPGGFLAAGLVAVGGTPNGYGISATGTGNGVGAYLDSGVAAPPLYLATMAADPTTVATQGCFYSDSGGQLRGYMGSNYKYVGCQAWAKATTDGAGGGLGVISITTPNANLGFLGASLPSVTVARFTFDVNTTNFASADSYCAVASYKGTGAYVAKVASQHDLYVEIQILDNTHTPLDLDANNEEFSVAVFGI